MEESHGLAGWREILGVLLYECDDSMLLVDASAGPVMAGGGRGLRLCLSPINRLMMDGSERFQRTPPLALVIRRTDGLF